MIVDSSIFCSYYFMSDRFHAATAQWLEEQLSAGHMLTAPTLLVPEIVGAVSRTARSAELGMEVARQLLAWPGLNLVPVDEGLTILAAQVASTLSVSGADSVYLALAQRLGMPLITWNDEQRTRGGVIVPTQSPIDVR